MFFQILYKVAKGLLEMDGHIIDKTPIRPAEPPAGATDQAKDVPAAR